MRYHLLLAIIFLRLLNLRHQYLSRYITMKNALMLGLSHSQVLQVSIDITNDFEGKKWRVFGDRYASWVIFKNYAAFMTQKDDLNFKTNF